MSRFKEGWEQFGVDKTLTQRAQGVKRQTKESPILPDFFLSASQSEVRVDLPLDEKLHRKIQRVRDRQEMMDLDLNNILVDGAPEKKVGGEFYQYTEEKVTAKILRELVDWLCCGFEFTYIDGLALYVYLDGQHVHFHFNFAARYLTEVFREYEIAYPLRSADFKEIVRLLQVQPQIVKRPEECRTDVTRILFSDGCFMALGAGRMCEPRLEDYQFSKINFPLNWGYENEASEEVRNFIIRFCDYDEQREKYLWELIGYLLSSYQQKIIAVLMGPSNSGKSTLANMVRRICGTEACVAMGIKELSGNFNLAELHGKRLCIDAEMDATALNARDISLLKKVVGNDLLQGNRKHEPQFYFQCQTKFLLCTNNKIRFRSDEDTVSFFNRMKIFELKNAIPLEDQIYNMDQMLDRNRTYFLQQAMKGLLRLVANNFQFSYEVEPEKFIENINKKADLRSIDEFVRVCCQLGENCEETVTDCYTAYVQFAQGNDWEKVNIKSFSCHLVNTYDIFRKRTNRSRFFRGIKLMTDDA